MAIDRRSFLAGATALGFSSQVRAAMPKARLLAAARAPSGVDQVALWSRAGDVETALAGRGHGVAHFADDNLFAIAGRRPGHFIDILDGAGTVQGTHPPQQGRIFAGHVAPVGRTRMFLATEIDERTGHGFVTRHRVGAEASDLAWETHGLGPHDLTFLAGGGRLVVANGGLETAEDRAGAMIDPDTIESSLAILDMKDGRLIAKAQLSPALRSLSIRHMAPSPDGTRVAFGMQDKKKDVWRPLVGVIDETGRVELFDAPKGNPDALRSYVGSVAIDTGGTYVAVTSPHGGRIEAWTLNDGRAVGGLALDDVCGLAADTEPHCFWATSGLGAIKRIEITSAGLEIRESFSSPLAFDNHLVLV